MINRCLAVVCLILVSLSSHARFLNQDPAEGNPQNPPSLHKYLYAYSNPAINVDPDGREVVDAVNGATTALTNLLFGGNVEPSDYANLSPQNKEYLRNKTYTQGYLKKRYEVDFRTWSVEKEIFIGPSLGEELKSLLTFGVPELAKKVGTTFAAGVISQDKSYTDAIRNKADFDLGNIIPNAAFTAITRKVPKLSSRQNISKPPSIIKEAEGNVGTEIAPLRQASFGNDSVGAARVKGSVVEGDNKFYRYVGEREAEAIRRSNKIPNIDAVGNKKDIYITNRPYKTAGRAKTYNQLPSKPKYRVEIDPANVPNRTSFTKVKSDDNPQWGKGGGVEATTKDAIPVDPNTLTRLKGN